MSTTLRHLFSIALLVGAATFGATPLHAQRDDAATLAEAQRGLKQASDQLDRAQRELERARRTLRRSEEDLEEAQRNVERRRNQVEEAKQGVVKADAGLAEAQKQHEAARAVIEKLYDGQQR